MSVLKKFESEKVFLELVGDGWCTITIEGFEIVLYYSNQVVQWLVCQLLDLFVGGSNLVWLHCHTRILSK